MKKQTKSEKIRKAMLIAVASMMVIGMPMMVNAEEGESSSESGSESGSESKSESKSESSTHESSEKASAASSEAGKAVSSAKESSDTASSKSEEAKSAASEAKSEADSVNSDSEAKNEMSKASSEAKEAVDKAAAAVAEKDAMFAASSETQTANSSEEASDTEKDSEDASTEDSEEIKAAKEITQGLEKAIETIESGDSSITEKADSVKDGAGAAISEMKDNFETVFSDDATITEDERKEAAQAIVDAAGAVKENLKAVEASKEAAEKELADAEKEYNAYAVVFFQNTASWDSWKQEYQQSWHDGLNFGGDGLLQNAEAQLANYYSRDERPDLYALLQLNYDNMRNSVLTDNKEAIAAAEKLAQDAVGNAQAVMAEKLGAYNEAAAKCDAAADAAQAAGEAARAAAEKAELSYYIAEEAAKEAANAVDADNITDAERDNIYFAQVDTAKATLEARNQAAAAEEAARAAQQQRQEVEDALDEQITEAQNTLKEAQENLAEVERQACKYDSKKAFGVMLERLTNARQAVEEAKQALAEAQKEAADYQKFAAYYLGTDQTANIAKRKFTAYAQLTKDRKEFAYTNEHDYDVMDNQVVSRDSRDFKQVSAAEVDVPDEIYRLYLKAMVGNQGLLTRNGAGIATGTVTDTGKVNDVEGNSMPVVYWRVDEETGQITGECFTDITYQPDGTYFVGYVFKREADMNTKGYHIDGFMIDHKQTVRAYEVIPDIDPVPPVRPRMSPTDGKGGSDSLDGSSRSGGSGSSNPGTTVPVVTITDDPVSLADMIDQAAIEILDEPVALASAIPGDVLIEDEAVPLADSIPQTGDSAVSVLPIMASGIAALGAALGLGKRKEEK